MQASWQRQVWPHASVVNSKCKNQHVWVAERSAPLWTANVGVFPLSNERILTNSVEKQHVWGGLWGSSSYKYPCCRSLTAHQAAPFSLPQAPFGREPKWTPSFRPRWAVWCFGKRLWWMSCVFNMRTPTRTCVPRACDFVRCNQYVGLFKHA